MQLGGASSTQSGVAPSGAQSTAPGGYSNARDRGPAGHAVHGELRSPDLILFLCRHLAGVSPATGAVTRCRPGRRALSAQRRRPILITYRLRGPIWVTGHSDPGNPPVVTEKRPRLEPAFCSSDVAGGALTLRTFDLRELFGYGRPNRARRRRRTHRFSRLFAPPD